MLEGEEEAALNKKTKPLSLGNAIVQIMLIDMVLVSIALLQQAVQPSILKLWLQLL
jgi:hypothetical protein